MGSEWEEVPIGSLCEGIYDGPHATPKRTDFGPVFLGISSLMSGRIDLAQSDHLSEEDFPRWTKRVLPRKDDLVFSYETRLGEAALIPEGLRCCLGRRMGLMRLDRTKADPRFLLYAYLSPQFQNVIRSRTKHGSTVTRILLTEFDNFPISVPPLEDQREIGSILASLDDRIVLLEEQSKTLETMGRSIFKSWFVDFDPVRAKAEGREPEGMDAATAALFPNIMGSQLPLGWTTKALGVVCTIGIGKTPPRGQTDWFSRSPHDVIWVSIRDMGRARIYIRDSNEYLTREAIERFNIRVVPDNTVILSFKLTVGRLAITDGLMTTNEAIAHCVLNDTTTISAEYLYCALAAFNFTSLASTSSIAEAVNSKTIRHLLVTAADDRVVSSFSKLVQPLFKRIQSNLRMAATLTELRDALLPRLISGKLRLREAKQVIESAL